MPDRHLVRLATAALVFALAACSSGDAGDPTKVPEERTVTQTIDIPNVFAALQADASSATDGFNQAGSAVEIRKIRLTVYGVPGGQVLFQQVYDVDPTQSRWTLPFTAPANSTVRLVAELMSVTAGVERVEYSGQAGPVQLVPCGSNCAPIPIPTHPGPVENLGATSVTVSPRTPSVVEGQSVSLTAAIAPAGPAYRTVWSSLDPAVATVSENGLVTAVKAGTARIRATVGARSDTATVTVTAAARTVAISAGDGQTAAAGATVAIAPAVQVRTTTSQTPVAGVTVTFEVVSGGGSVTNATAVTNAQGIATVGSWSLGTTVGANTLRAAAPGTENGAVTFSATAVAGPASQIAVHAGANQTAPVSTALPVAPAVVLRDSHGNPVAGAAVTFEVTSGGGTISGASATTDAQGVATAGTWTLGPAAGTQVLTARAGALSTTLSATATATSSSTCVETAYTLGATVNGEWTTSDCLAASGSGRRYDMYAFTIAQQTAFRAQVSGPNGRRVSLRRAGTQDYVQLMAGEAFMPPTANPLEVRYVLAPGSYVLEIATPDATTLGSYTLATSFDASASCNPLVFITTGVTISEQLSASDCVGPVGGKEDWFLLLPDAGVRLDMTLTTTSFAPVLVLRDDRLGPASPRLAHDIRWNVGATARVAYSTTFAGFHEIIVSHANAGGGGAYTLNVATAATANTCVPINTTIGGSRFAVWESSDCTEEGVVRDRYPFTLSAQSSLRTTLNSAARPFYTGVFSGTQQVVEYVKSAAGDLVVNWFLAPGTYELRAGTDVAAAPAAYTLDTAPTNGDIGCATNATSGNVSFDGQTLGGTDCTFGNRFEDRLVLYVQAGQEIVVDMNAAFAPAAIIRDPLSTPGNFLVRQARQTPGSVTATHRAASTGYYQVIFGSDLENVSGSYSGAITVR